MSIRLLVGSTGLLLTLWLGFTVWHNLDPKVEVPALLGALLTTGFGGIVTATAADIATKLKPVETKIKRNRETV